MKNWQKIWEKKGKDFDGEINLLKLIKYDGFDTGYGSVNEKDWLDYVDYISSILNIKNGQSLFEVGCGSGAFLYDFYHKNHPVAGIDLSESLINIAKKSLPNSSVHVCEAIHLETEKKYDFVISNGVFFYFTSLDYAKIVFLKMIEKANHGVAVLDVNDFDKKDVAINLRKNDLSEEEYSKRYKGLDHLYYQKQWFYDLAEESGYYIEIHDQKINNYISNNYRFNVFLFKNKPNHR